MSDPVSPNAIERIVGTRRRPTTHYGRAVSAIRTVYILHSARCLDAGDLHGCAYSLALDGGIDVTRWRGFEDRPVPLRLADGQLLPGSEETP